MRALAAVPMFEPPARRCMIGPADDAARPAFPFTPFQDLPPNMDTFVIQGGRRLFGRVRINGSKNSALPLLAGVLLTDDTFTLCDVPPSPTSATWSSSFCSSAASASTTRRKKPPSPAA